MHFRFRLAGIYEKLNMAEEAIQVYRKILEFQPNNKEALTKLKSLSESNDK